MRSPALLACVAIVGTALPAAADPIVIAPGGTRDELQAVVDALTEPTVVLIPPGEWECVGTVRISTDGVTLLGSGAERTRLYRSADHADTALRDSPFIRADGVDRLRVTGLRIDGVSDPASDARERGVQANDSTDVRIDHCVMSYLGFSGVVTYGTSRGVVDHCRMLEHFKPVVNNLGYGVTVFGDDSYSGLPFGTAEATFIEDCFFTGARHASASNRGARYVFRHNHVTANENSHAVDAHGDEYNGSSDAGTEWIEVYENLIDQPVHTSAAVRIRGGGGLVWNNEVQGYGVGVSLTENTPQPTGPVWIWDNTWGAGVTPIGGLSGSPEYYTTAPTSYTPYTYPHPLVTDLDVQAGPDMVVAYDAASSSIYLDGSATSSAGGNVTGYRWIEDADQVISTCARDVVDLAEGQHVLVLEAERDDGYTEVDSVVVDVEAAGPLASAPDWAERWFVPLTDSGTVAVSVTPAQDAQDAYLSLAGRHRVGAHPDSAALVRTSNTGVFEAYDGDHYGADAAISYQAGESYQVQIDVDLAAQTYSVQIDGSPLATDYAFRRPESSLGQLTAWHSAGGLTVEDLVIIGERAQPDEPCRDGEPAGGAGGVGGAAGTGGAGTGGSGAAATGPGIGATDDGGCGCRAAGRASAVPSWLLLLAVVGLGRRHAQRRRSRAGARRANASSGSSTRGSGLVAILLVGSLVACSADETGPTSPGGAGGVSATGAGGVGGTGSGAGGAGGVGGGACSTCTDSTVTVLELVGTPTHGAEVTACGCGFGSKSPAAPILYDDFEGGAVGETISGPRWSTGSSTAGNEPRYSTDVVRPAAGQSQSAFQNFVGAYNSSLTLGGLGGIDELYFHGFYHAIPTGAPTRNTKLLYLAGNSDWGEPDIRFFDVYFPDSVDAAGHNQFDDCNNEYHGDPDDDAWHDGKLHPNQWVRMEAFAHLGTAGQRDGRVWLQRRTDAEVDRGPDSPAALLRYDECDYDRLHVWSYFATDTGTPTPGLELYWDEIYVDDTQARIELGDAPSREACSHLEIQIPTAWSEHEVSFRLNRGTLPAGEPAYLYVVDRDGQVNADGLPVTPEP